MLYSPQIAILDFGSQYSHLIARRVRELHVYCELYSCLVSADELKEHELIAVILSGGPSSVYDDNAPHVSPGVWKLLSERKIPVLGICYGMQELAHVFGGMVAAGLKHEYGKSIVKRVEGCQSSLFEGMPQDFQMWMSHGDKLTKYPDGFKAIGKNRKQDAFLGGIPFFCQTMNEFDLHMCSRRLLQEKKLTFPFLPHLSSSLLS